MSARHSMQPIVNVDGAARFKPNKLVQAVFDFAQAPVEFFDDSSDEDREQLAQLLGFSVEHYVAEPYVSLRSSHEAQLAEDELNPSSPYAHEFSWVDETNASCVQNAEQVKP